jgi:monovalent cation/proton antiporter MnhG/PhaG subunit
MTDVLTAIAWLIGSAFALLAAVGVLRMPDVFTRMQVSTKASTRVPAAHHVGRRTCHRTCVVSRQCAALGGHRARRARA